MIVAKYAVKILIMDKTLQCILFPLTGKQSIFLGRTRVHLNHPAATGSRKSSAHTARMSQSGSTR